MSRFAEITFDSVLKSLEEQRLFFTTSQAPTKRQLRSLGKALDLFKESPGSRNASTRSRRQMAKRLLIAIVHDCDLGLEPFFICIVAIRISDLALIRPNDGFIKRFGLWWRGVNRLPHLKALLPELDPQWTSVMIPLGIVWPTNPAQPKETPGNPAEAFPRLSDQEAEQPQDEEYRPLEDMQVDNITQVNSDDDDNDEESEDTTKIPVQPGISSGHRDLACLLTLAAFTYRRVYKLEPSLAAQWLSTTKPSECDLLLTVPLLSGATPFITFKCSQKMVMESASKLSIDADLTLEPTVSHKQYQPNWSHS